MTTQNTQTTISENYQLEVCMGTGAAGTPQQPRASRRDEDNVCGFIVGMGAKNTGSLWGWSQQHTVSK